MLKILILALLVANSQCLYDDADSNIFELTTSNFDKLVINSDNVWIVKFFAPWCGYCERLVPEYQKTATALQGVVKVGIANVDQHKDLGQRFDINGYPTIKIFGVDKNRPETYNGERTAQGMVEAAMSVVQNKINANLGGSKLKEVVELTDDNFNRLVLESDDMWLVEFYAPWCGHCKNLAPHWARAATDLKGKVKLGAIDATIHKLKASQLGVQGYPTIKHFPSGQKDLHSANNYDGGRSAKDIVTWALEKLSENLPPPDVLEILNNSSFKQECHDKSLCVVSVLPDILDCQADCRNAYLDILKKISEMYKKSLWGWVWTEAGAQVDLENSLDIGEFSYPTMAVVNFKKMKYSSLRGSYSYDGINEFLRDLLYSRGNTLPIKGGKLPDIVEIIPWDGNDVDLPIEEDEDDVNFLENEKDEL